MQFVTYVEFDNWYTIGGTGLYDPIEGHSQGYESLQVENSSIFIVCLFRDL